MSWGVVLHKDDSLWVGVGVNERFDQGGDHLHVLLFIDSSLYNFNESLLLLTDAAKNHYLASWTLNLRDHMLQIMPSVILSHNTLLTVRPILIYTFIREDQQVDVILPLEHHFCVCIPLLHMVWFQIYFCCSHSRVVLCFV